jgi:hypothetical protein
MEKDPYMTEWEATCKLVEQESEATCDGLEPPTVIVTKLVGAIGACGAFTWDEEFIFINPDADNLCHSIEKTRIHETIHYILWYSESGRVREVCESEHLARKWASILTGSDVDPTWPQRYGCAKPTP